MNFTKRQLQIVELAIGIICDRGVQELTMKNIAHDLHITEPAIYRHFKNKEDIILGILSYLESVITVKFEELLHSDISPENKFRELLDYISKVMSNTTPLASLLGSKEIFSTSENIKKRAVFIFKRNQSAVIGIISECQKSGFIRDDIKSHQLAMMTLGSMHTAIVVGQKMCNDNNYQSQQMAENLILLFRK